MRNITYLHEFDRALQCPAWGYPTEGAYYRDAASTDALLGIRIPFLSVQAEDDPVSQDGSIFHRNLLTSNRLRAANHCHLKKSLKHPTVLC